MTNLHELANMGQAIWFDYIRRSFTESGDLQALIEQGVRGVTSNPSIFEKAIAGSADYDSALTQLVGQGKSVTEIYEVLAIEDIQKAADLFRPLYDETQGADGYVSLEVSPTLAHDTDGTISDAKRLFAALGRPNIMIKIPSTPAGIPAIEAAIAAGINVNVTLIFSLSQYEAVAEAYITGLERLAQSGGSVNKIASVASFFISRVDTAVDTALEKISKTELQGKIALDNAKVAYARFKEIFSGSRWEALRRAGAQVQRPLWASTGTKNPNYSDTLYLDQLIGPDSVNTVPPATLNAFMEHGTVAATIEVDVAASKDRLAQLANLGVDLEAITQTLQDDGVAAFVQSFESLMQSVAEKRDRLLQEGQDMLVNLGSYQTAVEQALTELLDQDTVRRIWQHDHTVWRPEPTEITNRLGWLHSHDTMADEVSNLQNLAQTLQDEGYTHALVLGMGGSSLAPELFSKVFGPEANGLDLAILDSTDPGAVSAYAEALDLAKTVFLVSTKSGGTVETHSFFKYFYNRVADVVGPDKAGAHFIAITDPGSKLTAMAEQYHFRKTYLNASNIGGRYSALSFFGLVPAALVGVDLTKLLDRAATMACNAEGCNCPVGGDNRSANLGVILGELAKAGRDKVTLLTSPELASFGDWVEQLIAESTGKEGRGILPVVSEAVGAAAVYGNDRLFVCLRLAGDSSLDDAIADLETAGHPVVQMILKDLYDIGGQFFLWEMATAIAGARLNIQPFDQPNVESAKILARDMVVAYQAEGKLPELTPTLQENGTQVYGDIQANTSAEALQTFLAKAQTGAYISLQAYVQPTAETDVALSALRTTLRDQTKLATTLGYGPRFLHSTGQLHKGDGGQGLFIQITADDVQDSAIPDEAGAPESGMSFGVLKAAQALGDRQALLDHGRQVLRFHFGGDVVEGLKSIS